MRRHLVVSVPLELRGGDAYRWLVIDTETEEAVGGFAYRHDAVAECARRNGEEDTDAGKDG